MDKLSKAANITHPGCCDSSLLLQSKLGSTAICAICWDPLVTIDSDSLERKESVVWKKCG